MSAARTPTQAARAVGRSRDLDLRDRLDRVRGVMFDVDGCLLLADQPSGLGGVALPGAARAIETARATGRRVCFFTNGSMQAPSAIAATLRGLGVEACDDEVLTPAVVAAETLGARYPDRPLLVFGDGVRSVFRERGVPLVSFDDAEAWRAGEVAAVVVGWDTAFGRSKIQAAAEAILGGADLYTTSDAPSFASHERLNVGVSGFIAAGLAHVTSQPYTVLGKPSAEAFAAVTAKLGASGHETLVVGDDLDMETSMARRGGALAALVTTGTHTADDAAAASGARVPDLVLDSLEELADLLAGAVACGPGKTNGKDDR
ncbi:HAD-IIA family hydrolase [Sinomonas flava]|uniref:HAD-IIA family hydrolase n=1 Tax=Sinomonas flava TaxID=496857 RepID=UPI0039A6DC9F